MRRTWVSELMEGADKAASGGSSYPMLNLGGGDGSSSGSDESEASSRSSSSRHGRKTSSSSSSSKHRHGEKKDKSSKDKKRAIEEEEKPRHRHHSSSSDEKKHKSSSSKHIHSEDVKRSSKLKERISSSSSSSSGETSSAERRAASKKHHQNVPSPTTTHHGHQREVPAQVTQVSGGYAPRFVQLMKSRKEATDYGFCSSCCEVQHHCKCPEPCYIGAVDGHPRCAIPYMFPAVYGSVGSPTLIWSLSPTTHGRQILAPIAPATIADVRAEFGFTDPADMAAPFQTRKGEIVMIANYTGINESNNGMYIIDSMSSTQYILRKVNFTADREFKAKVGSKILIRFGSYAFIYNITALELCDANIITLEPTNYSGFEVAVRVHPVAQDCCCDVC